ncbi:putative protein phosphatase 2C 73 [Canna indica]|uniref:protein-serine/threonine phosphatase n=1 Tax=Canna indica TaxID=4628 RepID=A0AAQ3JXP7_9LILI|nr:putative protein phosphatase 2C 73 [Canna indica]
MGGCCSRDDKVGKILTSKQMEEEEAALYKAEEKNVRVEEGGARVRLAGASMTVSMFSQQGWKGVNQDAMTIWENFAGDRDKIFCGVFDGHGPSGHKVASHVRDNLPSKLQSQMKQLSDSRKPEPNADATNASSNGAVNDELREWFASQKTLLVNAHEEVDKELGVDPNIDCVCSGSTAVTILKQREHLIIANLGDSRAVLGTRDKKNRLVPLQLTVDQKPNLPGEAERIRSYKGRIFYLREEPDVYRIWLPDEDSPGLAMARAFGDFCLKDFGLIATPQIFHRFLSEKDEFVVLATDGIWDVLSNKEVMKIVSSAPKRSEAAKLVVNRAVRAWRKQHPTSKIDDCTVICLFLKPPLPVAALNDPKNRARSESTDLSCPESFRTARSEVSSDLSESEVPGAEAASSQQEWTALQGVCRSNSLIKIPRFAKALSCRGGSVKVEEDR